jgi:hypothetical protein
MELHYSLGDEEFERQFGECTLDPTWFTHEAHLRLAWIHVTRYGLHPAIGNICAQLRQFVVYAGAADKYDETLTIAAIRVVAQLARQSQASRFMDFMSEYPQLKTDFRSLTAALDPREDAAIGLDY